QTNVVGGMIVSDYAVGKSNALYQEPDPDILADLLAGSKNMGSPTPGPIISTNGIWVMSNEDTDYGKNYLG
ncbi:MAG: hypothetical protein J6X60_12700, partial [Ruminiclostridium sp.]|nr:hypothetical protein [Ruminiclostridium sp.]